MKSFEFFNSARSTAGPFLTSSHLILSCLNRPPTLPSFRVNFVGQQWFDLHPTLTLYDLTNACFERETGYDLLFPGMVKMG